MTLATKIQRRHVLERQARNNGDAMPTLLAADDDMRQAGVGEGGAGKLTLPAFDFLQAQHVGAMLSDEPGGLLGAQPH
jgi:hypothetical protein